LLKFLGRHERLDTPAERALIFKAIAHKIVAPSGHVFVQGEDERMALALLYLLRREEFEQAAFDEFCVILKSAKQLAEKGVPSSPVADAAKRNAKQVLRVLLQALRSGQVQDVDRADGLEERILCCLRALG
jgi:hypothetical protein